MTSTTHPSKNPKSDILQYLEVFFCDLEIPDTSFWPPFLLFFEGSTKPLKNKAEGVPLENQLKVYKCCEIHRFDSFEMKTFPKPFELIYEVRAVVFEARTIIFEARDAISTIFRIMLIFDEKRS